MKKFVSLIAVCATVALVTSGSAFAGGGWQKLGSKAVVFSDSDPQDISIETKDVAVSEIKFKVVGTWTRFLDVTLNIADGSSQEIEQEVVDPGTFSDAVKIEGGPKVLASIDISCEVVSSTRGGRATITVIGR